MANVELSNDQVVDLVRQLPPERKREVLLALAGDSQVRREQRMQFAEEQLRRLCTQRGLDWDTIARTSANGSSMICCMRTDRAPDSGF